MSIANVIVLILNCIVTILNVLLIVSFNYERSKSKEDIIFIDDNDVPNDDEDLFN